jgi:hypothetical protein
MTQGVQINVGVVLDPVKRYDALVRTCRKWVMDRVTIAEALLEIRDHHLYRHKFDTFEECCQHEFELKRSTAYKLLDFANVRRSLKGSPAVEVVQTSAQTKVLAQVPEEKRAEVVEQTANTGEVTPERIAETVQAMEIAPAKPKPQKPKPQARDKTGYPIPDEILSDWKRAEAFNETLRTITEVKTLVGQKLTDKDIIFAEIHNSILAELGNAFNDLKQVLPYAVCPTCQGRVRANCTTCRQRGFVSKFFFDTCIPQETKNIRERAMKKSDSNTEAVSGGSR